MSKLTDHIDRELVAMLQQNDADAYIELYDRYHTKLYYWLLQFIKLPELAEDIVQETFLKVWEIRGRLRPELSFAAFLYRIARNRAIKALQKITTDQQLRSRVLQHFDGAVEDSEDRLQWHQYQQLLNEAIRLLPGQRRKVFILCRQEGKSYEEAAAELGISRNTVKEYLVMAVKDVKAYFSARGDISISLLLLLYASTLPPL